MRKSKSLIFYWIAVAMALFCVILVIASHWAVHWRFEFAGIELPWLAGGVAIAAILIHEFRSSTAAIPKKKLPDPASSEDGHVHAA